MKINSKKINTEGLTSCFTISLLVTIAIVYAKFTANNNLIFLSLAYIPIILYAFYLSLRGRPLPSYLQFLILSYKDAQLILWCLILFVLLIIALYALAGGIDFKLPFVLIDYL